MLAHLTKLFDRGYFLKGFDSIRSAEDPRYGAIEMEWSFLNEPTYGSVYR
jgi:hypothetical protein